MLPLKKVRESLMSIFHSDLQLRLSMLLVSSKKMHLRHAGARYKP